MKRTGRRSSWTFTKKEKLMRLPNNLKGVSQSRISKKISVSWRDINHKSSKMVKNNYKREKTPNSNDIQASKAKNRCRLSVD